MKSFSEHFKTHGLIFMIDRQFKFVAHRVLRTVIRNSNDQY
jgi:hypothetical protein